MGKKWTKEEVWRAIFEDMVLGKADTVSFDVSRSGPYHVEKYAKMLGLQTRYDERLEAVVVQKSENWKPVFF